MFIPLYSISLFLPTIIKSLGYENNEAQLMTVPPYVVGCFFTIGGTSGARNSVTIGDQRYLPGGFFADRYKQRGVFMIGFCLLAMAGFTMLIASENVQVQYAGTFLAVSGIYPNIPGGVAWNGNNIGGSQPQATKLL